jgi:2-iminoacetate synthase
MYSADSMAVTQDFIRAADLDGLLARPEPTPDRVQLALDRALARETLDLEDTAALLRCADPAQVEAIAEAARRLKREVYGNRIVLFAPLYIGNHCMNDCSYCAFRRSNLDVPRHTLTDEQLDGEVRALEAQGHKRLILVFGEHRRYDADFIARTVQRVYATRDGADEIRRVNINAAPLSQEGFARVKAAGIGTYQIFQESYHRPTYERVHPAGTRKGDYRWRLDAPGRAMAAGCDDIGIGALFGLYDWRYETLALVAHAQHLERTHGVGPHTISFPRLRPADGVTVDPTWAVSDRQLSHLVAVLRLAVPYAGLILTAREPAEVRRDILALGVSQIDGGSCIDIGGNAGGEGARQFELGDDRSLGEIMGELIRDGYLPSFCTACYRLGRTGEHFMEFAVPGFIKRYCTPNALCTMAEYLEDYADVETRAEGWRLVRQELAQLADGPQRRELERRLLRVRSGQGRDEVF